MKKILIILLVALSACNSSSRKKTETAEETKVPSKGKISGVVTYYLNDNLQYVADAGAKVFIANSSEVSKEIYNDPGTLIQFCSNNNLRNVWQEYLHSGMRPTPDLIKSINEYKLDDTAYFNTQDRKCLGLFNQIERVSKINKVVDASGNFSTEVDTGEYFVLVKSSHRVSNTLCEVRGKVFFKWVILKPDQEENVSPKFDENNDPFYGL